MNLRMECVCDLCRVVYQPWYADNDLWNAVMDPTGDRVAFLCPTCFIGLANAHSVLTVARITQPKAEAPKHANDSSPERTP